MSSFDEMRILQKEADLAKKKLQEVENAGKTASKTINESIRDISSSMDDFRICFGELKSAIDDVNSMLESIDFKVFESGEKACSDMTSKWLERFSDAKDSFQGVLDGFSEINKRMEGAEHASMNFGNYIGAFAPQVSIALSGIQLLWQAGQWLFEESSKDAIEFEKQLEETNTILQERADSWKNVQIETSFKIQNVEVEMNNIQSLWDELQTLVDQNGKVKKGYEERVEFILGDLNEALGTEMELQDGLIKKYKETEQSIDRLIEKRRAEALLEAYQPEYEEAIQKRNELYQTRIQLSKEIMEKEAKVNEAQKRADEAGQKFGMGWLTANSDLDNAKEELEELKNQFNLVEFQIDEYGKTVSRVTRANEQAVRGEFEAIEKTLGEYEPTLKKANVFSLDELKDQAADATHTLLDMQKRFAEGDESITMEMLLSARKFVDLAKNEYIKAGGQAGEGFIVGFNEDGNPIYKAAEEIGIPEDLYIKYGSEFGDKYAGSAIDASNKKFEEEAPKLIIEKGDYQGAIDDIYNGTSEIFQEYPFTGASLGELQFEDAVNSSVEGASTMLGENPLTMHTGSVTYGEAVSGAVTNANAYFGTNKLTMQTGNVSFFGAVANALFGANSQMAGSPLYGMNVGRVSYTLPVSSALIGANTMLSISPLSSMWVNKISYASPLSKMLTDIKNYLRWNPLQIFGKFAGWAPGGSVYYAANGGMIESPQITVVGEAGPESIIPLSRSRRSRALELYTQTSEALGIDEQIARAAVMSSVSGSRAAMAFLAAAPVTAENRVEINYRKLAQELYGALSASPIEVKPSFTVTGGDVYLDTMKAGKALAPHIDAELGKINHRRERGL